jgi:hypothetical protein
MLYVLQPCVTLPSGGTDTMVYPKPPADDMAPLCATPLEAGTLTLGLEAMQQNLDVLPIEKVREAFANIVQWFGTLPKTLEGK